MKLAKRYDIAIMSCKGMSVTAARELVDDLCGRACRCWCCTTSTPPASSSRHPAERHAALPFSSPPNVIDLGLHYGDIDGLPAEPNNSNIRMRACRPVSTRPRSTSCAVSGSN